MLRPLLVEEVGFEPTQRLQRILLLSASTALASPVLYRFGTSSPHALTDANTFILTQHSPPRLSNFGALL